MDISRIWRGLTSFAQPAGNNDLPVPESSQVATAAGVSPTPSAQSQQALTEILAGYDVTRISSREFANLIQELKQQGAISESEHEELALVRLQLDEQVSDPDEILNLVELFQAKLKKQQKELERLQSKGAATTSAEETVTGTLRQLDWISKFDLIHRANQYQAVNAVA